MYASFIIVLREALEAAMVIGIVAAATTGVRGSVRAILLGLLAGAGGAMAVAASADLINAALAGLGQEMFNASVLLAAVALLAWHQAWMRRHGAALSRDLQAVGSAVRAGSRPLAAVGLVVALAVLREGAEVVLFLYGAAAGGATSAQMLAGGLAGLAAGGLLGALLYRGLLRVPPRHLFRVTGWLLASVAAGMAAQAAAQLVQAGWLPALAEPAWDSSSWLPLAGVAGQVLHGLAGYDDRPTGLQLLFFAVTLTGMLWLGRRGAPGRRLPHPAATGALLVVVAFLVPSPRALADYKVYSPIVEQGEVAVEVRGHREFDGDPARDGARKLKLDLEYAPASRWMTELVTEWEQQPTSELQATEVAWENVLQLVEQGRYPLDAGLLLEYAHSLERGGHDKLEIGALLQKEFGRGLATMNLLAERDLSGGADTELGYALQYRWRGNPRFEPGVELYGEFGEVGKLGPLSDHGHEAGPVFFGKLPLAGGAIKYEAGWLFGLTRDAAAGTLKLMFEYEF